MRKIICRFKTDAGGIAIISDSTAREVVRKADKYTELIVDNTAQSDEPREPNQELGAQLSRQK